MEFNELEMKIITAINETGVSRMRELKEIENVRGYNYARIIESVKRFEEINIINREFINLGSSARNNFHVFELTENGKKIAESITGKKSENSRKELLLKEHNKLEIAYLFEDCAPLLKEKGITLRKLANSYFITINGETHPILLDVSKSYSRVEYLEIFDKMWENSSTFYYLSTSFISSSFTILDEIEAWLKTRNFSVEQQKTFQFKSSFMARILKGEAERWDTVHELWTDGLLRWSKAPPF